jgi:hypothetical protein
MIVLRRALLLLLWIVLPVRADNCTERMTEEGVIYMPRHHSSEKLEEAGGSCLIYLSYGLSAEGRPQNIKVYSEVSFCEYFHRSASKALLRSNFVSGVPESGCEHEYTISLEP